MMILSIISFVVALATCGLDQLTKFLVYGTEARSILGDFLWFDSTFNKGAAFSILSDSGWVFIVISSVASVVLCYLIFSRKFLTLKPEKISIGLLLGGAVSNLLDRIFLGGVRDFISLRFINFAIFNVADVAIVAGVILLAISLIVDAVKQTKKQGKNG